MRRRETRKNPTHGAGVGGILPQMKGTEQPPKEVGGQEGTGRKWGG